MKKIMIVSSSAGMGGVEKSSMVLAQSLFEQGYQVFFLNLINNPGFFELPSEITFAQPNGYNRNRFQLFKTLTFIRRNVKKFDPDVIIAYTRFYASVTNIAVLGTRYRVVFTERSAPDYIWPWHINLFFKLSVRLRPPAAVVSQTNWAAKVQKKDYKKSIIQVIPNIITPPKLYPDIPREKFILCVGRLNDDCKGFDLMIKAFNLIENTEWSLYFVGGDGTGSVELLTECCEDKRDRVQFLEKTPQLDKLYARAGIFVLPSRSEGFPNALAEASAAGVPAVSFDIPSVLEIITPEVNGILVNSENIDDLAHTLDELIVSEDKRNHLSVEALKFRDQFSANTIVSKYRDLFEKLSNKN